MDTSQAELLLDDAGLRELMKPGTTVAVVGVSNKPDRASYQVAKFLKERTNLTIYLVNPLIEELWGERVFPSITALRDHLGSSVDIVDAFRRSEDIPELMAEAIATGAKSFWMQLGIVNPAAAVEGREAGLEVIQNRCIKIEIDRLGLSER